MASIFVTGGTGFVGSNLIRRLVCNNHDVYILIRKNSNLWRLKDLIHEITICECDILDFKGINELVHSIKPEIIIHNAVFGGRSSEIDIENIIRTNFLGTINLLESLNKVDYRVFINIGSSSEYGDKKHPMKESDVCEPITAYGVAKASASMYCNMLAFNQNKNIGTLRLFSPYGDYEDLGRLIPDIIVNAIKNNEIHLANPNSVRDFIYIHDVVNIIEKFIKNPDAIKGKIYNIGTGVQYSVCDILDIVNSYFGNTLKYSFNSRVGRVFDTSNWKSDISKIKLEMKWEPSYCIEDGILNSIIWFKNNIELYSGDKTL